ncbi:hypothetical protein AND_008927 [Anopheles darlingi]|uniref:Secreted protein n=1 Tax=Anopheles darlingi TaxID=43151 RepID=W5J9G7_ANODA|nr:uncharacterized protein LOC125953829 [Anopheles darlingi]ETN59500.1 hypothetical protein AND_008927 [Anopheles darlingi]
MYSRIVVTAVLWCCLAQVAHSKPDFGIDNMMMNRTKVLDPAIVAKQRFLRVYDYIKPVLQSSMTYLSEATDALNNIAKSVNKLGPELMDSITTAYNSREDVNGTFSLIDTVRDEFEEFVGNELLVEKQSLTALLQVYVSDQLEDNFFHLMARIRRLVDTLHELKAAVQAASNAVGGGLIPEATLKQYVSEKLVNDLSRGLTLLGYRIPVMTYTIQSSLENIKQGDDYFYGLSLEADRVLQEIVSTGTAFYQQVSVYRTPVEMAADQLITQYKDVMSYVQSVVAGYANNSLVAPINELNSILLTSLNQTKQNFTTNYLAGVQNISTLLPIDTNYYFPPGKHPAEVLVQTLIANWKFSRYCFWKYSGTLYNLLLVSNYASECYDREVDRLLTLQDTLLVEMEMMAYNLEVAAYADTCMFIPTSANRETDCVNEFAAYYRALNSNFAPRFATFLKMVDIELRACSARLSVCWQTRVQESIFHFEKIVDDILKCGVSGPLA